MSRINLIALVAFVGLLAWVFLLDNEASRRIQSTVLALFSPFQRSGAEVQEKVEDWVDPPPPVEDLEEQILNLQVQNQQLQIQNAQLERLVGENDELRAMLAFEKNAAFKLIPARVVGRDSSTWWNTITIDKGYRDYVAVDSPVLTDRGLVGKTAFVNPKESTVILLTDERCQVAARLEGTTDRGILTGVRGATKAMPDLRLRFLDRDANPPPGTKVYSSNDGGLFPVGIPLGEVRTFESRDVFGVAFVRPAVDFTDLKFVFVIEREEEPESARESAPSRLPDGGGASGRAGDADASRGEVGFVGSVGAANPTASEGGGSP